ncbi:aldehyde dehydrogenase [Myriangium duriaei CBS 260.36]|uniref:aldehyde dehydrogenase (NAD(+)) n=1 Tax=Myriangium duriaei CBS 260.36 TaxID=1168546 RepID=A0A9P4MDE9_9PEZI|nr:aldehyde dehydrogenase [Myriangium duriaei CBS 260.36]
MATPIKPRKPEHIETRLFINGKFKDSSDGKTFKVINPANLDVVAEVAEATVEDTNEAVAAAKAAFPAWRDLGHEGRKAPMMKFAKLIREQAEELAYLEAVSMGKPVTFFHDHLSAADHFETFATLGWTAHGKTTLNTPDTVAMTLRQPYGVVAGIIPWNVPLLFFCWKAAAALAGGNTVVIKSSEKAPLTSCRIAQLINEAGFPPGVLNVLSGHGNPSGVTLSEHMDVRAISFTGSLRTGRLISAAAAKSNLKTVILELGGKSPLVIFDDCDLDKAVNDSKFSITALSGQMCMASSRVYVQDTIADKFIAAAKKAFANTTTGDPLDPNTFRGPQADQIQQDTVNRYIQMGKDEGIKIAYSGDVPSDKGNYTSPTIFLDAPEDSKLMREEIFGSVVNISTFKTEEEVLEKANNTEYGLYASVYTKDIDRALRFAKGMEAGSVGINCTSPTFVKDLPFGGYKCSGVGREGMGESLDHYLETKTVIIKLGS